MGSTIAKEYYRRRLPHYHPPKATFFITFRLAGSLPTEIVAQLMEEREFRERLINKEKDARRKELLLEEERKRYFGHFDSFLDKAQSGNKWLADPNVADIVSEAIKHRDGKAYDLLAYCIMPNHVHLVVDVERSDASLYRILQSLKAYTAVKANGILSRSGQFWQHESYDHVVRSDAELKRIIQYVAYNPVKAGLCKRWQDWRWIYVVARFAESLR